MSYHTVPSAATLFNPADSRSQTPAPSSHTAPGENAAQQRPSAVSSTKQAAMNVTREIAQQTADAVKSVLPSQSIDSLGASLPGLTWLDALVGPAVSATLSHFHCKGVCPHHSCFVAVLRGFRQGVVYGAKVRFPHALVMTFLFRKGPLSGKINDILKATYQHSFNLGRYVALFKLLECCMRHLRQQESGWNQLAAGFVAGGVMFGKQRGELMQRQHPAPH